MAKKVTAIQSEDKIAVWELEKYFENISDISGWLFFCQWLSSIPLHFMYLLATPLSVIYASLDYAFTIRIDFTSTTAGLASLASYVQLTKPMFFFFNYFSPKVCPPILGYFHYSLYMTLIFALSLALDQALRGASSNYVSGISMLLSFQISANQRECKQTLKNTCQG